VSLELVAGIDDIATERALSSGWSFVVLPKADAAQFSISARAHLATTRLTEFHAKEFKHSSAKQCTAYENLLSELRKTAENAALCLIACSLYDDTFHPTFTPFVTRVTVNVFATLGISDQSVIDAAPKAASPIFTLMRLLTAPEGAAFSSIEIDQDTPLSTFAAQTFVAHGKSMPATQLLAALAEAYRKQYFPRSPQLVPSGLAFVDSSSSFLVQAADVLGNFSVNYLMSKLGTVTKGRALKAKIFETVFGDLLTQSQFGQFAVLTGSQAELAPSQAGALTFTVAHVPT
jgi:hypothetical protein